MMKAGQLVWFQRLECGYVAPRMPFLYGREYFEEYGLRSRLMTSDKLMLIRRNFVVEFWNAGVLDFGCGALTFVEYMRHHEHPPTTTGYDINPWSVASLVNSDIYQEPYTGKKPEAVTFWDTLEHLEDPERIINRVGQWAFVCMPIYEDMQHVRGSKHYKPGEHIWYFTDRGIRMMFDRCGFECVGAHGKENGAGRSGIKSYAFRKRTT